MFAIVPFRLRLKLGDFCNRTFCCGYIALYDSRWWCSPTNFGKVSYVMPLCTHFFFCLLISWLVWWITLFRSVYRQKNWKLFTGSSCPSASCAGPCLTWKIYGWCFPPFYLGFSIHNHFFLVNYQPLEPLYNLVQLCQTLPKVKNLTEVHGAKNSAWERSEVRFWRFWIWKVCGSDQIFFSCL